MIAIYLVPKPEVLGAYSGAATEVFRLETTRYDPGISQLRLTGCRKPVSRAVSWLAPGHGAGLLPPWEHGIGRQGILPEGAGHCSTFIFLSVCVAMNVFRKV